MTSPGPTYDPIRSPFSGGGTIHTATDGRDILVNDPDGWEIDAPWIWWEGPANGDGTGGPFGNPPPGAGFGGGNLGGLAPVPAVTRCLQLTADKVASLPWKVYRGRDTLEPPSWLTDPQALARDGRRPFAGNLGVRFSGLDFWAQHLRSTILLGEGITYTPRIRDENGEPTGPIVAPLYNLNPRYLELSDDGRWLVDDPEGDDPAHPGKTELDARELIVTRNIVRPGYRRGLGVLEVHAADFAFSTHVREFADTMFQRGIPNGYLKTSKPDITDVQAAALQRKWMGSHSGMRKKIAVLNATTEFHPIDINPQTMQYVDMTRLSAWEIALIFGVPPAKLGINMGASLQYQTLEMANTEYVQDTLALLSSKMEAAIDAALPVGQTMQVDFADLLRGDTAARYASYSVGLASGFLTVDEVRAAENLPPMPAGTTPPAGVAPGDPTDTDTLEGDA